MSPRRVGDSSDAAPGRAYGRPALVAVLAGLVAGVGYPFVDVALACRVPASEACVWGKAYFPLTLGLSVVMVGGGVAGLVYAGLTWFRRRKSNDAA